MTVMTTRTPSFYSIAYVILSRHSNLQVTAPSPAARRKRILANRSVSYHRQRDERAAVALTDDTHERRVVRPVNRSPPVISTPRGTRRRECGRAAAGRVGVIAPIDLADDGVDRAFWKSSL